MPTSQIVDKQINRLKFSFYINGSVNDFTKKIWSWIFNFNFDIVGFKEQIKIY